MTWWVGGVLWRAGSGPSPPSGTCLCDPWLPQAYTVACALQTPPVVYLCVQYCLASSQILFSLESEVTQNGTPADS